MKQPPPKPGPPSDTLARVRADARAAPRRDPLLRSRLDELATLHREHRPLRVTSLLANWCRGWFHAPAAVAVEQLAPVAPGQVGITFGGHATALVRYANRSVVCDPMLGLRLGMIRRATAPGLRPADLGDVDLVLLSHGHGGHLHLPTLRRLPTSATVVTPPRSGDLVAALGFAHVVELAIGTSLSHHGIDITAAPVRHEVRGARSACAYVIRGDGPSVFFCGDSGYFSGFAETGRRYRPDIALLPIGGYVPLSFRERHMSPLDALYAFEDLGARMLVPIHHGAFSVSYEALGEPLSWLGQLVAARELEPYVTMLAPGGSRRFAM